MKRIVTAGVPWHRRFTQRAAVVAVTVTLVGGSSYVLARSNEQSPGVVSPAPASPTDNLRSGAREDCLPKRPPYLPGGLVPRPDRERTDPDAGVWVWRNEGISFRQTQYSRRILREYPEVRDTSQFIRRGGRWAVVIPSGDFPPAPVSIYISFRRGCVTKNVLKPGADLESSIRYARRLLREYPSC